MTLKINITEKELRALVLEYIETQCRFPVKETDIIIEVKSKQNYRAEWEVAEFRAVVDKLITE